MAEQDNQASNTNDERRASERREIDRRAFWRPTPDRRREATEQGRRERDADPSSGSE